MSWVNVSAHSEVNFPPLGTKTARGLIPISGLLRSHPGHVGLNFVEMFVSNWGFNCVTEIFDVIEIFCCTRNFPMSLANFSG